MPYLWVRGAVFGGCPGRPRDLHVQVFGVPHVRRDIDVPLGQVGACVEQRHELTWLDDRSVVSVTGGGKEGVAGGELLASQPPAVKPEELGGDRVDVFLGIGRRDG